MNKLTKMIVAASAMLPMVAMARSLIHYFDFDTLRNGSLAYAGVDKGTRPADFTFKNNDSASLGYTTGALGSEHAFYSSNKSSIWLGDGSASLGCGTTQGFTISFWCKPSASHTAWSDFFGFRVGGRCYRFEYTTNNSSQFTFYSSTSDMLHPDTGEVLKYSGATANVWHHFAIVATPNGTNSIGTCAFFVDGGKVANLALRVAGDLQQINIGTWQRDGNGNDLNNKGANNTGIDEVAVFDYPATAEQVKWLAKYKPAQPFDGPGRTMPICFLFDTILSTGGINYNGVEAKNSGTWKPENVSAQQPRRFTVGYANYTDDTALSSAYAFYLNNACTYIVGSASTGDLGATIGSGFSFSFWIKTPSSVTAWRDFMSFLLGDRYEKLELARASNPVQFGLYGTTNATDSKGNTSNARVSLKADTWQHVCMVWNSAESAMEFYLDGEKLDMALRLDSPDSSDALRALTIGRDAFNSAAGAKNTGTAPYIYIDEVAIFNHSLSTNQIAWLRTHIPCLPPLDATNLVRTVSADCAWAGGLASWGVKEWDGEAWANTTRTTIYPALEDTEVETAVEFASGATITNDTFVTPKRLVLSNASGAESVSPTLVCAEGSRFAPQSLEVGDGVTLNVSAQFGNPISVGGTLTIGEGSRIVFNADALLASDTDDNEWKTIMEFGDVALPTGAADILAFVGVQSGKYRLALSSDGKSVLAKRARGLIIIVQ